MAKHKQKLVELSCGVRSEVDAKIANLIVILNRNGIETRHSCQGRKQWRGYISMFAGRTRAKALGQWLLLNHGDLDLVIEISIHPHGYEQMTIRFQKKDIQKLEKMIHHYFAAN